jgi:hypothetical protein
VDNEVSLYRQTFILRVWYAILILVFFVAGFIYNYALYAYLNTRDFVRFFLPKAKKARIICLTL